MTSDLLFHVGALRFRLTGQVPALPEDHLIRRFSLPEGDEDVTVGIARPAQLTPPEGDLRWESSALRVFTRGDEIACYYRDAHPPLGWDYARLCVNRQTPEQAEIQILREAYPYMETSLLTYLLTEFQMHLRGQTILHASWVMQGDQALLFSGPSGAGKSTQAELWHEFRGSEIVNGDKTAICFPDGTATAVGLPFCGSSKYCLDRSAPIRAIVMLAQATENNVRRLRLTEAVRLLAGQMPVQAWDAGDISAVLELAERLAREVPVYFLSCTKDERAVSLLERTLEEDRYAGQNH